MIDKTVSAGRVIVKIYRDLNLKTPDWEEDAIEWIGEALAHVGVGPYLEKKSTLLAIANYRAELPDDYVRYSELFHYRDQVYETVDGETVFPDLATINPIPLQLINTSATPNLLQGTTYSFPDGFLINGGYIVTSFETGVLALQYYGMVLDDDGYPMVPDDPSFMDAFLWYVIKQMILGGWRHPNPEISYGFARNEWLRYCSQARSAAKAPGPQHYDELMMNWSRMVELRNRRLSYFTTDRDIIQHSFNTLTQD